jgi:hypothetical protein
MSDTLSTALIFFAIALLEGVRHVEPGSFVVLRVGFGRWTLASPLDLGRGFQLIAWGIPVAFPVVLGAGPVDDGLPLRRLRLRMESRARRVRWLLVTLRIGGTLALAGLVVGVPVATSRWGAWGLILSLSALLALCAMLATLTCVAMRRAGAVPRDAVRRSLKVLWPFTAPRAGELVQAQVVSGVPPLAALHTLLGETAFVTSVRPLIFDALKGNGTGALDQLYDRVRLAAFVQHPPPGSEASAFCPRCAHVFRRDVTRCSDCDEPLLHA